MFPLLLIYHRFLLKLKVSFYNFSSRYKEPPIKNDRFCTTQPVFSYSKLVIETPEKGLKYV